MQKLPLLVFDALFVFFAVVVYGASAAAAVYAGELVWGEALWRKALAIVAGYFAFLHAFIAVVAVVRRLVQPKLSVGFCDIGFNKKYFAWGLNSVFQGLFTTAFFDRQVHIVFYLKYFYYRAMGMKLSFGSIIGTRAVIRQAELIELGSKVVLGEMCGLYGHVTADGKKHFQGRIKIGSGSVIGAYAVLGPDVEVGEATVIGAQAKIAPMTRIGNRCSIGANAFLPSSIQIPDDVRIHPCAVVMPGTEIKAGETWAGHPAVRVEGKRGKRRLADSSEAKETGT